MKLIKIYDFSQPVFFGGDFTAFSKLRGTTTSSNGNISTLGGPYEMTLRLEPSISPNKDCHVFLSNIELENIDTNAIVFSTKNLILPYKQDYKETYFVSTRYKNIELSYADHELSFDVAFNKCKSDQSEDIMKIKMLFEKEYKERNISFWDVLMGI